MLTVKHIKEKDIDLCYELDSSTISFWTKQQWAGELKKEGTKVLVLFLSSLVVGICVFHVVLDEAQINFFVINNNYRKKGYGTHLMNYLIKQCEILNINKLLLEVSLSNTTAEKFYSRFDFRTVGIRKNYYKDGSDALLKEKNLATE